jgi:hypothetical protein
LKYIPHFGEKTVAVSLINNLMIISACKGMQIMVVNIFLQKNRKCEREFVTLGIEKGK